jgi:uncharacterized protein (TIGR02246 family)
LTHGCPCRRECAWPAADHAWHDATRRRCRTRPRAATAQAPRASCLRHAKGDASGTARGARDSHMGRAHRRPARGSLRQRSTRTSAYSSPRSMARWNARDAAGLAQLHAGDADVWSGGGSRLHGREAIRESLAGSFAAAPASLRHRTLVEDTSLLAPDVASADGRIHLEDARGDSAVVVRRMRFTAVAVRASAEWRVRLVRIHAETADRAAAPSRRDL